MFLRLYLLQMAVEACPKGSTSALELRVEQKWPSANRAEPRLLLFPGEECAALDKQAYHFGKEKLCLQGLLMEIKHGG